MIMWLLGYQVWPVLVSAEKKAKVERNNAGTQESRQEGRHPRA